MRQVPHDVHAVVRAHGLSADSLSGSELAATA